jgi:hypothetical protein
VPLVKKISTFLESQVDTAQDDVQRDKLLLDYRHLFRTQISHDLRYNLQQLEKAVRNSSGHPIYQDSLERLQGFEQELSQSSKSIELWHLCQRFYTNALALAEYLYATKPHRFNMPQLSRDGSFKRSQLGYGTYRHHQGLVDWLETLVPNQFTQNYLPHYRKNVAFWVHHYLWPWSTFRHRDFMDSLMPWVRGIEHIRQQPSEGIHFSNALSEDDRRRLFSSDWRTHHNTIFVASHRLGFLDLALIARLLEDILHGIWINADNYGTRLVKKMMHNQDSIFIRGGNAKVKYALKQSVKLLTEGRPILIVGDGLQSSLLYGQQNTVEKGVRLLADESVRQMQAIGSARKTLVIPITLSDPVGFILNQSDKLIVHMHRPLEISEPSCSERDRSYFDEAKYNGGDALLNHLEALFLVHTNHLYTGWHTPDVLSAVTHKHQQKRPLGIRSFLYANANTSLFELSRYQQSSAREGTAQ